MKNILTTALAVLSLVVGYSQTTKTDLQKENLKGKVKLIKEIAYRAIDKNGTVEKGKVLKYGTIFTKYNEEGNKIEESYYDPDGELDDKYTYEYDKEILIEKKRFAYDGRFDSKWIYTYNKNIIEVNRYWAEGGFVSRWVYIYDENKNLIKEEYYDLEETLSKTSKFKYDEKGNLTEEDIYLSESSKIIYTYDENRVLVKESWYNSDGGVFEDKIYKYEYDSHGNWIQKIQYSDERPYYLTERKIEYY